MKIYSILLFHHEEILYLGITTLISIGFGSIAGGELPSGPTGLNWPETSAHCGQTDTDTFCLFKDSLCSPKVHSEAEVRAFQGAALPSERTQW